MSNRIGESMDSLKRVSRLKAPWRGKRFEWLIDLAPSEVGEVGERLAAEILQGERLSRADQRQLGYDISTKDGKRIEVKLCRESFSETNIWSWKQIRSQDNYSHLCLIAASPEVVRCFLIPRSEVPAGAVSNLHTKGGDGSIGQIGIANRILPQWVIKHEIF